MGVLSDTDFLVNHCHGVYMQITIVSVDRLLKDLKRPRSAEAEAALKSVAMLRLVHSAVRQRLMQDDARRALMAVSVDVLARPDFDVDDDVKISALNAISMTAGKDDGDAIQVN